MVAYVGTLTYINCCKLLSVGLQLSKIKSPFSDTFISNHHCFIISALFWFALLPFCILHLYYSIKKWQTVQKYICLWSEGVGKRTASDCRHIYLPIIALCTNTVREGRYCCNYLLAALIETHKWSSVTSKKLFFSLLLVPINAWNIHVQYYKWVISLHLLNCMLHIGLTIDVLLCVRLFSTSLTIRWSFMGGNITYYWQILWELMACSIC